MKHIVIVGNPVDGFWFIGPFGGLDLAHAYARKYCRGDSWWAAPISSGGMWKRPKSGTLSPKDYVGLPFKKDV